MDNKINPGIEKNGSNISNDSDESIDKGKQSEKKQRGVVARFLAWIARGTEQASKNGSFCSK